MSASWVDTARSAVLATATLIEAHPEEAALEPLRTALALCSALLEREPDAAAVFTRVDESAGLAIGLSCDRKLGLGPLLAISTARNACLGALHDPALGRLADAPATVALLTASRTVPCTRAILRERYTPDAADPGVPAAWLPETASTPEPENDSEPVGDDGWDREEEPASRAWDRPKRKDWRPEEGVQPPRPPVRVARACAVVSPRELYAEVVGEILDIMGTRGRERVTAPFDAREEIELSILALTDALLATGGGCVAPVVAWWRRSRELDDPWLTWAAVFALGSIAGADTADAMRRGLEELPAESTAHARAAAQALAVVRHPHRTVLAADLLGSPHPVARAVGVELSACLGDLSPDALVRHLRDPNLAVLGAAVRMAATFRAEDVPAVVPLLERLIDFPHADVAWPATRALLRSGNTRPYDVARSGGRLLSVLGPLAIEVFVLAGGVDDLAILQRVVEKAPVTPATLSALARFGHPGIWAYLLHQLANEDLVDDAVEALIELFGPSVPGSERRNASQWRRSLLRMQPDSTVRYRRGEPWRPAVVADEALSGSLSQRRMEPRLDELSARAGLSARPNLSLWTPDVQPAVDQLRAEARQASRTWPAAGWD